VGRLPGHRLPDGPETYIQSRDQKPLDRYFPELPPALRPRSKRCVLDGESSSPAEWPGLRFAAAAHSPRRVPVKLLAAQTPAATWLGLLALGDRDLRASHGERRRSSSSRSRRAASRHLTPATSDPSSPPTGRPIRVPAWTRSSPSACRPVHARQEAGRRSSTPAPPTAWSPDSAGTNGPERWSALLLALRRYCRSTASGSRLASRMDKRRQLVDELAPLRENASTGTLGRMGPNGRGGPRQRPGMPGATTAGTANAISAGSRCVSSVCARSPTITCRANRFRHATTFLRWRPDKAPANAGTTNWRLRRPSSWRDLQAIASASPPTVVVRVEGS